MRSQLAKERRRRAPPVRNHHSVRSCRVDQIVEAEEPKEHGETEDTEEPEEVEEP